MLYDTSQTTDLKELQVSAATGLVHRSLDNEIALTAQNMRLAANVRALQEELARVRNTDVAQLSNEVLAQRKTIGELTEERDQALRQFGTVKQRESTLKTQIQECDQKIEELESKVEELTAAPAKKATASKSAKPRR